MVYKTLTQLRTKIERDLDLQAELFITQAEIDDYINEAIDDVEAEIHTLYEDYFLTKANISLVSGTSTYSLPSDIYGNKIRRIIYSVGSTQFELQRLKDRDGFLEEVILDLYPTVNFYKYRIINTSAAVGPQIEISPSSQETTANALTVWYIRNANTLSVDADKCDIPEFYTYVIQYAKCRCYEKEPGHPNYPSALAERERLRQLMLSTLQSMVPDSDNNIEMDYSFYEDLS